MPGSPSGSSLSKVLTFVLKNRLEAVIVVDGKVVVVVVGVVVVWHLIVGQHRPGSLTVSQLSCCGDGIRVGHTRRKHSNTPFLQVQFKQGSGVATCSPCAYFLF